MMVNISQLEGKLFWIYFDPIDTFNMVFDKTTRLRWLSMVVEAAVSQGIDVDSLYRKNELELIVYDNKVHYAGKQNNTLYSYGTEGDMKVYLCRHAPALINNSEQEKHYLDCLSKAVEEKGLKSVNI